ncbi:uncharacterized protein LOC100180347 [Ciona intestinalis]
MIRIRLMYILWTVFLLSIFLYKSLAVNSKRSPFSSLRLQVPSKSGRFSRALKNANEYFWTQWSPSLNFTCKNGEILLNHIECANASGVVVQQRKCVLDGTSNIDPQLGTKCTTESTSSTTRLISCNEPEVCNEWSEWGSCVVCQNNNCTGLPTNLRAGQTRHRTCEQEFNKCTIQWRLGACVKRSVNGGLTPDGRNIGGGLAEESSPTDAISSSAKIAAFSVAGIVMVGLLGFAGTSLLRTTLLRPNRRRSDVLTVSHNEERNNSVSSPDRIYVVNMAAQQGRPRPVAGRRTAHPRSNLSVIREEEDVACIRRESIQNGTSGRNDSDEAMDFMDEVLTEVEREEEQVEEDTQGEDTPLKMQVLMEEDEISSASDFSTTSAEFETDFRKSVVANEDGKLFRDFGWNPEDRGASESDSTGIQPENTLRVPGSEQYDFSASALSLASARLLDQMHQCHSSVGTCESELPLPNLEEIKSFNSALDLRRSINQDSKQQFSSMPDLNSASAVIPDIADVLSTSSEEDFYDDAFV